MLTRMPQNDRTRRLLSAQHSKAQHTAAQHSAKQRQKGRQDDLVEEDAALGKRIHDIRAEL